MKVSLLTSVAFCINGAFGSGRNDNISIDEVKKRIKEGSIFDFLEETLGNDTDFSLLYGDDRAELVAEWRGLVANVDESRKMWVERNGLCLLVAYLLEGIQTRTRPKTA